jgi:hypothetical protein
MLAAAARATQVLMCVAPAVSKHVMVSRRFRDGDAVCITSVTDSARREGRRKADPQSRYARMTAGRLQIETLAVVTSAPGPRRGDRCQRMSPGAVDPGLPYRQGSRRDSSAVAEIGQESS